MLTTDPVVGLCRFGKRNGKQIRIKINIGLGVDNIVQDK
jgi:hypothetical protein